MPKTEIRPLHDGVLVRRVDAERVTSGGVILPDVAQEKRAEGVVCAVGAGRRVDGGEREAMDVSVGDRVLFRSYGGTDVSVGGDAFVLIAESDVLAVLVSVSG